jgi:hypothetical protein
MFIYVLVTQKKTKICPCVEEIKWHPTVCVEKCNHLFFRERLPVAITRDVAAQRNVWASTIRQKRRCFCFGPYDGPQVQRANRWTPVRPPSPPCFPYPQNQKRGTVGVEDAMAALPHLACPTYIQHPHPRLSSGFPRPLRLAPLRSRFTRNYLITSLLSPLKSSPHGSFSSHRPLTHFCGYFLEGFTRSPAMTSGSAPTSWSTARPGRL